MYITEQASHLMYLTEQASQHVLREEEFPIGCEPPCV
jgi:hypothetical protein